FPRVCYLSYSHYPSFFFNVSATSDNYTLSLHDALPISNLCTFAIYSWVGIDSPFTEPTLLVVKLVPLIKKSPTINANSVGSVNGDRKSTRLNSSHVKISYAVFCLKKKIK